MLANHFLTPALCMTPNGLRCAWLDKLWSSNPADLQNWKKGIWIDNYVDINFEPNDWLGQWKNVIKINGVVDICLFGKTKPW